MRYYYKRRDDRRNDGYGCSERKAWGAPGGGGEVPTRGVPRPPEAQGGVGAANEGEKRRREGRGCGEP